MKKPVFGVSGIRHDVPPSLCRDIGRVMVRWAYFENLLRKLVWEIVGVDEKVGRLVIKTPRIKDTLDLLRDIASLKGIEINAEIFTKVKSISNDISGKRDTLAHGAFTLPTDGIWRVVRFSGTWPKPAFEGKRVTRRTHPEAIKVEAEGLQSILAGIDVLIEWASELRNGLLNLGKIAPSK